MNARTTAEIAAWILPAFARVDLDDAVTAQRPCGLGSDDVPHLSLTERTFTEAQTRVYGEWGCVREVQWEIGKPGEAFYSDRTARRAAEYVAAFVRRNGRVRLSISGTVLNGAERREMVIESISDAFDQRAHDLYEASFPRVASTPRKPWRGRYSIDSGGEAVYDPALTGDE